MAELADALDSGSNDRKVVEVQVLLSAPAWRWTQFVLGSALFLYMKHDNYFIHQIDAQWKNSILSGDVHLLLKRKNPQQNRERKI